MTRNTRIKRTTSIGVERLDMRISPSGFSLSAVHAAPMMVVQLPHGTMPPTTPGAATLIPFNAPYYTLR